MFTRVMKYKNKDGSMREYLCLIESYRQNGKPKQRMVANLGRIDREMSPEKVDQLAEKIQRHGTKIQLINILKDLKSKASKAYGEVCLIRKVFKQMGMEALLKKKLSETNKSIDYVESILMAICNRLMDPMSKRGASEWKEGVYEPKWEQLSLQHMYRGMDFLAEHKEEMEVELFEQTKTLFNCQVNVVMFDTTTITYWGRGDAEVFQYAGRPKDGRRDKKHLVVGLIMDREGVPLGHEVWPGNMSDKPAFKEVIDRVKKKFRIEKVILICDKGMISEANIQYLEKQHYEYVLGVKMKQMSAYRQKILLREDKLEDIYMDGRKGRKICEGTLNRLETEMERAEKIKQGIKARPLDEETLKGYADSVKGKRQWMVCFNEQVAKDDEAKRLYFQQIIEKKVAHDTAKEWIVKNGYKKYVTISDFSIEVDQEKLEKEALFDGKWVLMTNTDLSIASAVRAYKELGRIEHLFRHLKSDLEVGPIYHWTERRVRAHIAICFMALQIQTYFRKKIKELDPELSYRDVMRDVAKIRANIFEVKGEEMIQRTEFQGKAHLAFKATGTQIPAEILKATPSFSQKNTSRKNTQLPLEGVVTTS